MSEQTQHYHSVDDVYAANFLKAEHLKGNEVEVQIEQVEVTDQIEQGKPKAVLHFTGRSKALVLNKTNAEAIARLMGSREFSEWIGKTITLYPDLTQFRGDVVPCIRVRLHQPKPKSDEKVEF